MDTDLKNYNNFYMKNNYLIIDNLIDKSLIDNAYKLISSKIFNKLWYLVIYNGHKKYIYQHNNKRNINGVINNLKKNKNKGIFTYYMYRTFFIPKNKHLYNLFLRLSSPEFIDKISKITNENISKIDEIFISKYNKNCFLDIHTDKNKGKIAFTLQLSKNFSITDGGVFYLLNEDYTIKKAIVPCYNSFLIFKVTDNSKHYVSAINNFCNKNRYTITGWFS